MLGCLHRQLGAVQMKRRDFIALLGSATAASAAWPMAASAQVPPKVPRLSVTLEGTGSVMVGRMVAALRQGLGELGYVEGQTIALEVRMAEGRKSG